MKRGEKIVIERTMSGHYKISRDGHPSLIGGAASTAAGLAMMVFQTEASETPEYIAGNAVPPAVPVRPIERYRHEPDKINRRPRAP